MGILFTKGVEVPGKVTLENLDKVFTYQKATPEQEDAYREIRDAAVNLGTAILEFVPDCADRSTALRTLRETRMWANAAIALNGEV